MIELEIEWDKNLDWIFGFGVPTNRAHLDDMPRLETWDDSLVLSHKDSFEIVYEKIDTSAKRLKLLIHWDRQKNVMVIHDERGAVLAKTELGELPPEIEPGIFIENKGASLTIDELSIRRSSQNFDATLPSVQTLSDAATNARLVGFDGQTWSIEKPDHQGTVQIARDEFCAAFLINSSVPRPTGLFSIDFFDGMLVTGDVLEMAPNLVQRSHKFFG